MTISNYIPVPDGFKRCTKCGNEYPSTGEFFYKEKKSHCGFHSWCKRCHAIGNGYSKLRTWPPLRVGHKKCTICGEIKPSTQEYFGTLKNGKDGLYPSCRDCYNQRFTEWRRKKGEEQRKYRLISSDGKLKCAECNQFFLPDEFYDGVYTCKECSKKLKRLWRINNPEKDKAQRHRRLAKQYSLPYAFEDIDLQYALDYFDNRCALCERARKLDVDHWIPLQPNYVLTGENPGTVPENILPLCKSCNCSKKNNDPIEWIERKFGEKKAKQILKRVNAYFDSVRT